MICARCLRSLRPGAIARPPRLSAPLATAMPSRLRNASTTAAAAEEKPPAVALSSVPAGTVLKGLNIYRDKQDPVAMEDAEYPEWLWRVLDRRDADADTSPEGLLSKRVPAAKSRDEGLTVRDRQNDKEAGQEGQEEHAEAR
jgi:large subunit ribosomal protein L54